MARKKPAAIPKTPERDTEQKSLGKWRSRVAQAIALRKKWEKDYRVEDGENYFLGHQSATNDPNEITLNHLWASIKTQLPALIYTAPKFYVRPKPGQDQTVERNARIGEAVLAAIGDEEFNLKRAAKLGIQQSYFRIGALKICYYPESKTNPNAGDPIYAQDGTTALTHPTTGAPLTQPKDVITDEVYRYEWVDAVNMLLPDEGPDPSRWSWIGEEVIVPLAEAKDDPRFHAEMRARLRSNESRKVAREDRGARRSPEMTQEEDGFFRYRECYALREKKVYLWADGQDDQGFLYEGDLPEGVEKHPYALLLGYTPILGPDPSPWPVPHVYNWLSPQREYNICRQQTQEGGKRSARKVGYDDNTFANSDEAQKAMNSPIDMEGVKLNDTSRPPIIIESKAISPDVWRNISALQSDWRIITGQTGARLSDPSSDTATEVSYVERAANLRDAEMRDVVSEWLSVAGRKMWQRVKATLTLDLWIRLKDFTDKDLQEHVAQLYGVDPAQVQMFLSIMPGIKDLVRERFGQEKVLRVRRDELAFEADVTVVPGSSQPRSLDVERSQWLQFLRVIGQFPQLALSRELLRETASKFEYISDKMLDELMALAQKMIATQANQAGRNQGGEANGGGAPGGRATQGTQMIPAVLGALAGGGG